MSRSIDREFFSKKAPVQIGDRFIINDVRIVDTSLAKYEVGEDKQVRPIVFIYCTFANGNSGCIMLEGYQPYIDIYNSKYLFTKGIIDKEVATANDAEWFGAVGHFITKGELCRKNFLIDHTHLFWRTRRYTFARYYFNTIDAERHYRNILRKRADIYFGNDSSAVRQEIKFLADAGINSAGWNQLIGSFRVAETDLITTQHVLIASIDAVKAIDCTDEDPSLMMSFDIECIGDNEGNFPIAEHPSNEIVCIGCSFHHQFSEPLLNIMLAVKCSDRTDQIDEKMSPIWYFDDERDLLVAFCQLIMNTDVDILFHYNGNSFDLRYIFNRMKLLDVEEYIQCFSKDNFVKPLLTEQRIQKNSFKGNKYSAHFCGRFNNDLYLFVIGDVTIRLTNYKLDTVLETFTSIRKDKVKTDSDIIKYYKSKNHDGMLIVYKYCFKDVLGCVYINRDLNVTLRQRELANVSFVSLPLMVSHGEGVRALGSVFRQACTLRHWVIRQKPEQEFDEFYAIAGAHIDEPVPGFYDDSVIVVVDYNSLYPSIIIDRGISPDRLVSNADEKAYIEREKIPCFRVRIEDKLMEERFREHWFIATDYDPSAAERIDDRGILPNICMNGLNLRGTIKKRMKQCPRGSRERAVLDSRQAAIKVDNNSKYGVMGTPRVILYSPECAESITAAGRELNKLCNKTVQLFNGLVVYGDTDSKFVKMKLLQELNTEQNCKHFTEVGEKICREIEYQALLASPRSGLPSVAKALHEYELKGHDHSTIDAYKAIKMGVDKVLYPALLVKKKDYKYFERREDGSCGDYKTVGGIQVRRNISLVIRNLHADITKYILTHAGMPRKQLFDEVMKIFHQRVLDILAGKFPIEQFAISSVINDLDEYDDVTRLSNAMAVKRQIDRGVGEIPHPGDRINFVFVTPTDLYTDKKTGLFREAKASDQAELLDYVKDNDIPVWYEYYVTHMSTDVFALIGLIINPELPDCPTFKQYTAFCDMMGYNPTCTIEKWKKLDDDQQHAISHVNERTMRQLLKTIVARYGSGSKMRMYKNAMNKRVLKRQESFIDDELKKEVTRLMQQKCSPWLEPGVPPSDTEAFRLLRWAIDDIMKVACNAADHYVDYVRENGQDEPEPCIVDSIFEEKVKPIAMRIDTLRRYIKGS